VLSILTFSPGCSDSATRWSLDHLFLDADGIPTLVEVKRGSDTRYRVAPMGRVSNGRRTGERARFLCGNRV
jgi:hypothetical protein